MRSNVVRIVLACLVAAAVIVAAAEAAAAKPAQVKAKPSAGCGVAAPVATGETQVVTTTSAGVERSYFQRVPPAHDGSTPVPLVLDIHGLSEGATIHKLQSKLGEFGDEQGFVTITPQGLGDPARWGASPDSEDAAFIGELLDEVERGLCIDERRVFVTGLSMGAMMTSALVCAYSDRFAAAAPVAGIIEMKPCEQDRPVPVVAFHGTEDRFLAFEGGVGPAVEELFGDGRSEPASPPEEAQPDVPSVPEVVAGVAKRNGCSAKPTEKAIGTDVTLVRYKCPKKADVHFYRVEGGGHSWPGSEFAKAIENVVGHTTFTIDANEIMWAFFEKHPLRGA